MPLSLDFAFEGFRIIRERPKLIVFWGLVLLVGGGLMQLLLVAIAGPDLERFQALLQAQDAAAMANFMERGSSTLSVAGIAMLPIELVMNAVLSCAVYRAVWGEKDDRFGYLRFGSDEWRQIAVLVLLMLICFAMVFAITLVATLVASLFGTTAGAAFAVLAIFVFGMLFLLFVLLRLSLCGVQSFDRKAVDIFGSWKLTAKHGWALLGGYLVAGIMALLVATLCGGILGALETIANAGRISVVEHSPDMTSLHAYLTPKTIIGLVFVNLLVAPLITALRMGAQAAAYRTLAGHTPDPGI